MRVAARCYNSAQRRTAGKPTARMNMATQTIGRRRFSVDEYYAMAEAGILGPDERVELLDGVVYTKHPSAIRRFTVDEYYAMAEAGILAPDERVELLAGEIITMAPIGSRHAFCVTQLTESLFEALGRRVTIRVQNPIRLTSGNEPEPDIAVLRRSSDGYASAHPRPEDVLLLIEVADSTIGFDRRHKVPMYAMYGIPEVWLFDVNARGVEVYDEPLAGGYTRMRAFGVGDILTPLAFPEINIRVSEVMPQ